MSKAFSAFYDDVMPELPGIRPNMVDAHLLRVARQFCDRTAAWHSDFGPIDSEADTLTYAIYGQVAKTEVVRVLSLTVDDVLWWLAREPDPDVETETQPRFQVHRPPFTLSENHGEITFTEQPAGEISGVLAMRPSLTATNLPDVLYTEFLPAIKAGVLAQLLLMGGKPWTDRDMGAYYSGQYENHIGYAAQDAARGRTRALMRTRKTLI